MKNITIKFTVTVLLLLSLLSCSNNSRYMKLGKSNEGVMFLDTKTNQVISVEMINGSPRIHKVDITP